MTTKALSELNAPMTAELVGYQWRYVGEEWEPTLLSYRPTWPGTETRAVYACDDLDRGCSA